ncbi:hypothetical protein [Natronobacterium gregoryi]|uniref:Uncharacterized protein n=1 Tax=Natronobacterium gregoryi (strain ATCC 43098 / DSM 3393 / CCM 3738 / CIP 104747 / IAM 13177 / JCM 8860 / NBRC 102187 / NCIMB 2189 / SP2) TaxID=797304 RepID=L9YAF2_NATGS|nr:hypothetical protein [Natronobacterium gregoryi]ELY70712.1 hypothetical protein C490_06239 [Natronobacterium gregoryi SP2]
MNITEVISGTIAADDVGGLESIECIVECALSKIRSLLELAPTERAAGGLEGEHDVLRARWEIVDVR